MSQVLLLNASFEPIRVITTKRAVCLILAEKAEVVEEKPGRLRSASFSMATPCVIKLRHFVQIPYRATLPLNRRTLMGRDKGQCQIAGCERAGTTIDHLMPRSRGGKHEWTNTIACCAPHNFKKGDNTIEEMGWTLKKEPRVPKGTMWLLVGMGIDPDEAWVPYLSPALAS